MPTFQDVLTSYVNLTREQKHILDSQVSKDADNDPDRYSKEYVFFASLREAHRLNRDILETLRQSKDGVPICADESFFQSLLDRIKTAKDIHDHVSNWGMGHLMALTVSVLGLQLVVTSLIGYGYNEYVLNRYVQRQIQAFDDRRRDISEPRIANRPLPPRPQIDNEYETLPPPSPSVYDVPRSAESLYSVPPPPRPVQ